VRIHLTRAVLRVVADVQASDRTLAKAAGVSNALLTRLKRGDFQASPDVADKLAAVFERWAMQYRDAARVLRAAARRVRTSRTGSKP
jgi:predicted transcriptional regulator